MIRFQNHKVPGMTFLEVVLAISIATLLALGALSLQSTLLDNVYRARRHIRNVMFLDNAQYMLAKAALEVKEFKQAELKIEKKALEKKGALADLKDLTRTVLTVEWSGILGVQHEQGIYLKYEKKESEQQ